MDEVEQSDGRIRISLIDLFVWMSCTGLFCAVSQNSFQLIWQDNFTAILLLIPVLLAYPVGLTALFLFGMRRLRRKPTSFQPGHWLLCLQGVAGILYIVSTLKSLVIDSGYFVAFPPEDTSWQFYIPLMEQFVVMIAIVVTGCLLPVRMIWRSYLVAICFLYGVTILQLVLLLSDSNFMLVDFDWFTTAYLAGILFTFFLLIGLAVYDKLTTDERRDLLHWLGVVVTAQFYIPSFIFLGMNHFGFV